MTTIKQILLKKIIPGMYAFMFIVVLLLISVVLERRHIYF